MELTAWSNQVNEIIKDVQNHPCLWDYTHPDNDNEPEKNLHFDILNEKYRCDSVKVMSIWNEIIVTYFLVYQNIHTDNHFDYSSQSIVSLLALVYSFIKSMDNLETLSETNIISQIERLSNERIDSEIALDSKKDEDKRICSTPPISNNQSPQECTAIIEPENEAKDAKTKTEIYETSFLSSQKECEIFGQLIAVKMQHLNFLTQQILMNDIHIRVHETILQSNANRSHSSTQASLYNNPLFKKASIFTLPSLFQKFIFPPQSNTDSGSSQHSGNNDVM